MAAAPKMVSPEALPSVPPAPTVGWTAARKGGGRARGGCGHKAGQRGRSASRKARADGTSTVGEKMEAAIEAAKNGCLTESNLPWGIKTKGKVRDSYDLGDKLVLVSTDRQSAFDRHLASVPFKGQVLNQTSAWWFQRTGHIVPNGVISVPDPNITVMHKLEVFPVEFVVRGFMTGSTNTSLWTHYQRGERTYCGVSFPNGLTKNMRLPQNVITPTTKSATHDEPISAAGIVGQGLMSKEEWQAASMAALALFEFGQSVADEQGLILVDTKYEFGRDKSGQVVLIDEIHTPDSSRYWLADTYEERHKAGDEPDNIDKEFLRLWFRDNCDPYNDPVLPAAPWSLVSELSRRYITLFQKITGQEFQPAPMDPPPSVRMHDNVAVALNL